jgi:hypothetical protein
MKQICLFLFPASLLFAAASCNMEKRLYRKGWYTERIQKSSAPESNLDAAAPATGKTEIPVSKPISPHTDHSPTITEETKTSSPGSMPQTQLETDTVKPGEKPDYKKMSRRELVKSMKGKGCAPNKHANTVYWLSIISVCLCWFPPLSLLLAITTLVMCGPAQKDVMVAGECPRENLELIRKAKRNSWFLIIGTLAVFFVLIVSLVAFAVNSI